ncbi:MAG: DUF6807 family protein [Verrucomicrobiota bacterium]
MDKIFIQLALGWSLALPLMAQTDSFRRTETSLALLNGTNVIWQIVADPAQGKPYFHPLATPGGTVLTDLRPLDHPWHRGLWWSWKYINGLNYWEEDRKTGRSEAATELTGCELQPHADGSAHLNFAITYHPWNTQPVLMENRMVEISPPTNGGYELRWTAEFSAMTNVTLSRTPLAGEPNGKGWGGYAGLSLRLSAVTRDWIFSNSAKLSGGTSLHGQPARWMKISAGFNQPAVTIFDDDKNLQHLSPWYVSQAMPFVSPALLFREPLSLAAGEKMVLRYRIFITDHDRKSNQEIK